MNNETAGVEISSIAANIEKAHKEFLESVKTSLDKAVYVGEQLILVKENLEHGKFLGWMEENISFSERTAQKYMRIARKQDVIEEKGAKMISEAYESITNPREEENYHKRYQEAEDLLPDDLEDEGEDVDFVPPGPENAPEIDKDVYKYWQILQKIIRALRWSYSRLAPQRDGNTPKSLGYLIGNISEMADRLEQWNPEKLEDCGECLGSGWVKAQDQYGNLSDTPCPFCIGGKSGPFKVTDR